MIVHDSYDDLLNTKNCSQSGFQFIFVIETLRQYLRTIFGLSLCEMNKHWASFVI